MTSSAFAIAAGFPTPPSVSAAGRQSATQTAEFTALRIVTIAFWASMPAPQEPAANPNRRPAANQLGRCRNVTQIICLVTVTCHGNGAAARPPAQPCRISLRRRLRQWHPPHNGIRQCLAPTEAAKPGKGRARDGAAGTVSGPGRVA